MRGEHTRPCSYQGPIPGSSPHARGAPPCAPEVRAVRGIIPACAGSTCGTGAYRGCMRDHPRMRGEHAACRCLPWQPRESSPHARGARNADAPRGTRRGIIPACAGSTIAALSVAQATRDHPRMRGEHARCPHGLGSCAGSSPHARGAREQNTVKHKLARIIPACAGSTLGNLGSRRFLRDHPRMRGEH